MEGVKQRPHRFTRFSWLFPCHVVLVAMFSADCVVAQTSSAADSSQTATNISRKFEDQQLRRRLQELAVVCQDKGLRRELELTQNILFERDPGRCYIFLPDSEPPIDLEIKTLDRDWSQTYQTIRSDFAQKLFELSEKAAANEQADEAYQWLHEVLFWNPEHTEARTVLGHRRVDGQWQAYVEKKRVREASKSHPTLRWPAKSYLLVTTENFDIFSQADEPTTLALAENLQRWHEVWRQLFFDYWSTSGQLNHWLKGPTRGKSSSKRYQVTFFATRDDYVQAIQQIERQASVVGISSGYYHAPTEMSYFFNSPEANVGESWVHELTHQLFQEAPGTKDRPFDKNFLWLCEGVAMYMESLRDYGSFVTVGGWDAVRLQYARLRRFHDDKYLSLLQLTQLTLQDFQKHPEIRELYSQSAGLCHFLLSPETPVFRRHVIQSLKVLYAGRGKIESWEKAIKTTLPALDERYAEWLRPSAKSIEQFMIQPRLLSGLSLPHVVFQETTMARLGECTELEWLDLTEAVFEGGQLSYLASCRQLRRLFLTGCIVSSDTGRQLASIVSLEEIDLAGSNFTDEGLHELAKLPNLQVISVAGSKVTRAGIERLLSIKPNLRVVQ